MSLKLAGYVLRREAVFGGDGVKVLRGWHYVRPGCAPLSGLCPTPEAARRTAEHIGRKLRLL